MDRDWLEEVRAGRLLNLIRERQWFFLSSPTLTALEDFFSGWSLAYAAEGRRPTNYLPQGYNDWVAYRLHRNYSTAGYRRMILEHLPDGPEALHRFFKLLDEYSNRQARVVVQVRRQNKESPASGTLSVSSSDSAAYNSELVELVAFTDDPGIFVIYRDESSSSPMRERYRPSIESCEREFKVRREDFTILDPTTYSRWLDEEKKFLQTPFVNRR